MKKGMTLVEVLIAVSLFAVVAVVSSTILVSVVEVEKKSSVQNAVYEDLRMILQQLTYEIQNGTVDYEEYYNYYVIQDAYGKPPDEDVFLGKNYGAYASRFYDPGRSLDGEDTFSPDDLGLECSYRKGGGACDVVYSLSMDFNTGRNPFAGAFDNPPESNAFCEQNTRGQCGDTAGQSDMLFLIDNTGTKKTILGKKKIEGGGDALGLVRMEGFDYAQNGIVDTFSCLPEYACEDAVAVIDNDVDDDEPAVEYPITIPNRANLALPFDLGNTELDHHFIPISPLRSDIVDLTFIVDPLEDPYKAYDESSAQRHPSITIILTLGLSPEAEEDYPGEFEPITVQTTVAAGVVGKIDSYPPMGDLRDAGGNSVIKGMLLDAIFKIP
ncbi:MAG: prepilin-type N-terminal cleavage/methylation domain-containing protein [Candidatus Peregrinibacteria bacterium]